MKYVAFLRGVNVGGNKKVPMLKLKETFEKMRFTNVGTLLNSGNVVFESEEKDVAKLRAHIEDKLQKAFGFIIPTIVRSHKQIQALVEKDPFRGVAVTNETRLYTTFLSEKPKHVLTTPYVSEDKTFQIVGATESEVFSVVAITDGKGTTEAMKVLEKECGKNSTTRNWNTVGRIAAL